VLGEERGAVGREESAQTAEGSINTHRAKHGTLTLNTACRSGIGLYSHSRVCNSTTD